MRVRCSSVDRLTLRSPMTCPRSTVSDGGRIGQCLFNSQWPCLVVRWPIWCSCVRHVPGANATHACGSEVSLTDLGGAGCPMRGYEYRQPITPKPNGRGESVSRYDQARRLIMGRASAMKGDEYPHLPLLTTIQAWRSGFGRSFARGVPLSALRLQTCGRREGEWK